MSRRSGLRPRAVRRTTAKTVSRTDRPIATGGSNSVMAAVVERGRHGPTDVGPAASATEPVPPAGAGAEPIYIPPTPPPVYVPPATPPVYIAPTTPPVYIPPLTPPVYIPPATKPERCRPTSEAAPLLTGGGHRLTR